MVLILLIKYSDVVFGRWGPLPEDIDTAEKQGVFWGGFYLENSDSIHAGLEKPSRSEYIASWLKGSLFYIEERQCFSE